VRFTLYENTIYIATAWGQNARMSTSVLRFNFVQPGGDPKQLSAMYQAAAEMAAYGEERGLTAVNVEEHHTGDDGWGPSPFVAAAYLAGRTKTLQILVSAFVAPLYDPIRVAKELAVLDLTSGGRVRAVAGVGYRREEYDLFGADFDNRGRLMDEAVGAILSAWTGEPFEFRGRTVQVTPRPVSPAMALLMIGGSARPAARRAARHRLGFVMNATEPEVKAYYEQQCAELGTPPIVMMPTSASGVTLLSEDPDRAWATVGKHLLYEATRYGEWTRNMASGPSNYSRATTVEELRAEGVYKILTPEQAADWHRVDRGTIALHPMCGGIPPEHAWETVRLAVNRLLPLLADNEI